MWRFSNKIPYLEIQLRIHKMVADVITFNKFSFFFTKFTFYPPNSTFDNPIKVLTHHVLTLKCLDNISLIDRM